MTGVVEEIECFLFCAWCTLAVVLLDETHKMGPCFMRCSQKEVMCVFCGN